MRALGVAALWIVAARLLAEHGYRLLPRALLAELTLESYLTAMQLVATGLGLALAFALLAEPRRELGWVRARAGALLGTALLAPVVYGVAVAVAFSLALPVLRAELLARGVQQVQESSGQFGRELRTAPVALVLAWGVLISPVAEELVFRGPLWSGFSQLVGCLAPRPRPNPEQELPSELLTRSPILEFARGVGGWLREGGVATLVSAAVFGALHLGVPGGMGIVRVGSAFGLGVACGQARHATGSLLAPALLHVLYNLLAVGAARRWFTVEGWLKFRGVPLALVYFAIGCLLAYAILWRVRAHRRLRPE